MNKKAIIALAVIIVFLGTISIAKSYSESEYDNFKDFFLNKLSSEEKTDFEKFSDLNLFDKLQLVKQNQDKLNE